MSRKFSKDYLNQEINMSPSIAPFFLRAASAPRRIKQETNISCLRHLLRTRGKKRVLTNTMKARLKLIKGLIIFRSTKKIIAKSDTIVPRSNSTGSTFLRVYDSCVHCIFYSRNVRGISVKADSPAAGEGKRKPYKQNTSRVLARAMEKAFASTVRWFHAKRQSGND